jgi:hypothetical protein
MSVSLWALCIGRTFYSPRGFLVLISATGWVDSQGLVRPEGSGKLKNSRTPSRVEADTFRLLAQCLNQLRCRVRYILVLRSKYFAYQDALRHLQQVYTVRVLTRLEPWVQKCDKCKTNWPITSFKKFSEYSIFLWCYFWRPCRTSRC